MDHRSAQAPSAIVMIRPRHFSPNSETAGDNKFQRLPDAFDADDVKKAAYEEAGKAAAALEALGVRVHLFDDREVDTPDSVFPNNWFSTHPAGMWQSIPCLRRVAAGERRHDVMEMLKRDYRVQDIIDYSGLEEDNLFLEGTGAMVLDHRERVAYAIKSNRTDPVILERFCTHFNYEPMVFDAVDESGAAIYHTNVLMCIATEFVMIGLDMIEDAARREEIVKRFEQAGRAVIDLSHDQIANFAGNAIELQGRDSRLLALSARAFDALTPEQIAVIEKSARPAPLNVPTIELSGGSVRCMIAGIHLAAR